VAEALVKSKKYLVPLVVFSPYTVCGIGIAYLTGRFNPKKHAEIFDVAAAFQPRLREDKDPSVMADSHAASGQEASSETLIESMEDGPLSTRK
jgi:hypothetical protein